MTEKLFSYGGFNIIDKKTFRLSAKLQMNTLVKLDTGTEDYVNAATYATMAKCIGFIMPDEEYEGYNGTDYISSGDLGYVALRGPVISNQVCGSVVAIGDIITRCGTTNHGTLNRWITDPANQTGGTTAMHGIALQAGTNGTKIDFILLK